MSKTLGVALAATLVLGIALPAGCASPADAEKTEDSRVRRTADAAR
jgi:hypothetical protein